MKIAVFIYRYPLYPNGSYLKEFIDELSTQTESVALFAAFSPKCDLVHRENVYFTPIANPKFYPFGDMLFEFLIFFQALFSKKFRTSDVYVVISARGALALRILSFIFGKPAINIIEMLNSKTSLNDRLSNYWQSVIYKRGFRRTICWSNFYKDKFIKKWGVPDNKIAILPSGIDTEKFHPKVRNDKVRLNIPADATLIVFAKPLYEPNREMAEVLVEALLHVKHKSVHLLVGNGAQKEILERKIKKLGLDHRISFMPFVSIDEIPGYLGAADIIALPFTYDATVSRSLLEAMSMGKPTIVSLSGEVGSIVTHMENAYVTEPNPESFARAIDFLIDNKNVSKKLGESARALILQDYGIRAVVKKYVREFHAVTYQT